MRTDESGNPCPETLGEYRDMVMAICQDETNPAVVLLDQSIARGSRDEKALHCDSQMRGLLMRKMAEGMG